MHLLLVRHGETEWNREGRYQGRTDIPLADVGEQQVRRLGARLGGIRVDVAVSSPLARAKATADAILGAPERTAPACELELDTGLLEISHGAWEGMLASDVARDHAEMFGVWRSSPSRDAPAGPGAETLGDVEVRAWAVLEQVFARARDGTALIVAHDAVNRVILCRVLGLPLERVWKFRQAPAALNVIAGDALDRLQVVRMNDAEHSAGLVGESTHRAL